MNPVPEVSGKAFLGLIRQVKDRVGAQRLDVIVKSSGPLAQEVFREPIKLLKWYPYGAYVAFLLAIDKQLGRGDTRFCREIGSVAGKRDLGTIFRIYVALASPERLIRSCAKVWASYYKNAGHMEAIAWEQEKTVLRIFDFPTMHPAHCRLMEGWMIATMASIGCVVNDDGRESACASAGGPYHEFRCSWHPVGSSAHGSAR